MKTKKGSGLIFAVVLLFVILGMVVTLASVTMLETKMNQKTKSSVGAFYNSESGVEWALNQIATTTNPSGTSIGSRFSMSGSKASCPADIGGSSVCSLYLLDADGKVLASSATVDQIKAVRSLGTQGGDTQRAIEAAVAAGGGACYTDYSLATGLSVGSSCTITGFTIKGSLGNWGYCSNSDLYAPGSFAIFRPPGGGCNFAPGSTKSGDNGEAYLCCQQ
jgi:hypothetical protein